MTLYFVSNNNFKQDEAAVYLQTSGVTGIDLKMFTWEVKELLSFDLEEIVRHKVLQAFKHLGGAPCVVEHGGLCIDALNGLPSGLSRVVWDRVNDQLCTWIPPTESRRAVARSLLGYCDGKQVHVFRGETVGEIAPQGRGAYAFQWDPIFIPEGSSKTYAEMGLTAKGAYSQGRKAWQQLFEYLKGHSSL